MDAMHTIEILGPGCARCRLTFQVVRHVVEQEKLPFNVVKVESLERMAALGVVTTPSVAVDGEVRLSGRVPRSEEVRQWLGAPAPKVT